MIPVFQTRLTREEAGNCFEACVASILEVPIETVPDFGALLLEREPRWPELVAATPPGERLPWPEGIDELHETIFGVWLRDRGLEAWEFDVPDDVTEEAWLAGCEKWNRYWIASTQVSPLFRHATVWRGSRFVHQPTPGWPLDPATLGPLRQVTVFVAADPAVRRVAA